MRLFIDADACPVVDLTLRVAQLFKIQAVIVCDTAHFIEREGVETYTVQKGMDAVDFVITNKMKKGDLVVTQDYGLAAMVLAKSGYAINQNGFVYTEANIEQLLFRRHVAKAARKTGARLKGPKKRKELDNMKYEENLIQLCKDIISKQGESEKNMQVDFFRQNREKLMRHLENDSIVVLFSGKAPQKSADEYYPFTTNRNFYYLTGIKEQEVMIVLTKQEGMVESRLFIKQSNPVLEKWVGKTLTMDEAKKQSGIAQVEWVEQIEDVLHRYMKHMDEPILYLDFERTSFKQEETHVEHFGKQCKQRYPYLILKDIGGILSSCRMIKSKYEIDCIRKAIEVTHEGVEALLEQAQSNIMEYQLEAHFDFVLKQRGIKDYAFKTIAASGKNATILHYESNDSMIKQDELILFDLGAQYKYYNADISRTFPVDGTFTERQKQLYNIVLKAQLEVIKAIKPDVPFQRLNEIVKEVYLQELRAIGMVEQMKDVEKYYYHGVSHFLGLDTHDVGSRKVNLEEGMVLTVEPGLYIEEEGIGIRIEDDVLVTGEGCEVLSLAIPKTVEELEKLLSKRKN